VEDPWCQPGLMPAYIIGFIACIVGGLCTQMRRKIAKDTKGKAENLRNLIYRKRIRPGDMDLFRQVLANGAMAADGCTDGNRVYSSCFGPPRVD